jgi:serine/threonine protein kinase
MRTFNESTTICVVCGCLPTRLLTKCAPRRAPPLAAAKDLIARMMELDPARRLSADAVLSHSWMVRRASLCCAPLRVGLHTPRLCHPVTVLSFHGKAPLYGSQSNLSTHAGPLPSGYRTLLPRRANPCAVSSVYSSVSPTACPAPLLSTSPRPLSFATPFPMSLPPCLSHWHWRCHRAWALRVCIWVWPRRSSGPSSPAGS